MAVRADLLFISLREVSNTHRASSIDSSIVPNSKLQNSITSCLLNDRSLGAVDSYVLLITPNLSSYHLNGAPQQSSGRGGAGNIRSPSGDRVTSGPDDFSNTRGRDPVNVRYLDDVRKFSLPPCIPHI